MITNGNKRNRILGGEGEEEEEEEQEANAQNERGRKNALSMLYGWLVSDWQKEKG